MKVSCLNDKEESRLVRLKPGRYLRVNESPSEWLSIEDECPALLIENQGATNKGTCCWHVLVGGNVLLAWDDNFRQHDREVV